MLEMGKVFNRHIKIAKRNLARRKLRSGTTEYGQSDKERSLKKVSHRLSWLTNPLSRPRKTKDVIIMGVDMGLD